MEDREPTSTESLSREELEEQKQIDAALEKEGRKPAPKSLAGCLLRGVLVTAVLAIIALGAAYFGIQRWLAGYAVERDAVLATIRAKGDPLTAQELVDFLDSPKEPNELTLRFVGVLRAIAERNKTSNMLADTVVPPLGSSPDFPRQGEPLPLELMVKNFLADRTYLEEAEAIGEVDGEIRIPVDYTKDYEVIASKVNLLRQLEQELKVQFRFRLWQGDRAGALRTLRAMFRAPRLFDRDPEIASQYSRVTFDVFCTEAAEEFLRDGKATADELAAIRFWINRNFAAAIVPALKVERAASAFMLSSTEARRMTDYIGSSGVWNLPLSAKIADVRPGDTAMLLEKATELIEIAENNELPEVLKQFDAQEQQFTKRVNDEANYLPWSRHVVLAKRLPQYFWIAKTIAKGDARQLALKAAIDVEKKLHPLGEAGRTREAEIAAIEQALPIDPFTGEPMKYGVENSHYCIFSVGDNGKDDSAASLNPDLDVGVQIERTLSKSAQ